MKESKLRISNRHPLSLKKKAFVLRRAGWTHREIVKKLRVSLGSAHLWTKSVKLTLEQKKVIQARRDEAVFTPERREKLRQGALKNLVPRLEKHTIEGLLKKIRNFYKKHGRIPLKREFNMHREFKRRFGSWNRAIRLAGYQNNPELFAHKFVARDSHSCDSFTEKVIDDWLFENKIAHQRNFRYGKTRMTADFYILPNLVLEFFGLAGVQKNYDRIIQEKRWLSKKLGLKLVEIYPGDIYPNNFLPAVLNRYFLTT